MNSPELTILATDTDAACDPETGTCAIPPTPILAPDAGPESSTILGAEETPST
jgi:hypothetical protein